MFLFQSLNDSGKIDVGIASDITPAEKGSKPASSSAVSPKSDSKQSAASEMSKQNLHLITGYMCFPLCDDILYANYCQRIFENICTISTCSICRLFKARYRRNEEVF